MKKRLTPLILVGLALSAMACGGAAEPEDEAETLHAHLSDRYPSTTASDWITYADVVAVVTVRDEERGKPTADDLEMGEGAIPRSAELAVEEVVWQREGARSLPDSLDYPVLGWHFNDHDPGKAKVLVADDRPLYEEGNQYAIALTWLDARCYEGQPPIPGRWVGLGAGSEMPITNGVLGVGEFAGEKRNLETARLESEDLADSSVIAQVTGGTVEDLKALLTAAKPGKRSSDFDPKPSDC